MGLARGREPHPAGNWAHKLEGRWCQEACSVPEPGEAFHVPRDNDLQGRFVTPLQVWELRSRDISAHTRPHI